jgi:hypothetical protein
MVCNILPHSLPASKSVWYNSWLNFSFYAKKLKLYEFYVAYIWNPEKYFLILMFTNLGVKLEFIDCLLKHIFALHFNTPHFKFILIYDTNLTGCDNFNGVQPVMSRHFNITEHVAVKNYYSLLSISTMLHVSVHVCKTVKFVNS